MLTSVVMVALGGALGALGRFGLSHLSKQVIDDALPAATLAVNLFGCLAAGFLVRALAGPWHLSEPTRLGIMVGILGGLTTFSAFGVETVRMIEAGRWISGGAFIAANVIGGIGCVMFGQAIARVWLAIPPVAGAAG
jgi:CrcB protein